MKISIVTIKWTPTNVDSNSVATILIATMFDLRATCQQQYVAVWIIFAHFLPYFLSLVLQNF